jgi:hypothetical protein
VPAPSIWGKTMPNYRFVLRNGGDKPEEAEELGIFNDDGALQYARRISHNRTVEVWHEARLVGRVEPRLEQEMILTVETAA